MEEQNNDFLTPEERASLTPKEESHAYIVEKNISAPGERPTIITVLCGYFFISWILSVINIIGFYISLPINATVSFNLTGFSVGGVFAMILSSLYVVSVLGLWLMKKLGAYLFLAVIILGLIIASITTKSATFFSFSALLLPGVVIWMGFKHLDRMS